MDKARPSTRDWELEFLHDPMARFVVERIDEDEANIEGAWTYGDGGLHIISTPMYERMRAECEAKRAILRNRPLSDDYHDSSQADDLWDEAVKSLASIYADHPDYRQEWKP